MRFVLPILLLSFSLTACSSEQVDEEVIITSETEAGAGYGEPIRGTVAALEMSSEGELEVGITDEVLYMQLSLETRETAQKKIQSEGDEGGLGGAIADMVGGVVNKALATAVQIPLDEIEDLRFENGRLIIDGARGGMNINIGDGDTDEEGIPFEEDAAQRLIDAFEQAR